MPSPGTVLIRADGSHTKGLGHVYRSSNLARELIARGHEVVICTRSNEVSERLFAEIGCPLHVLDTEGADYVPAEILRDTSPDVMLLDLLETEEDPLKALRQRSPARLISIDDAGAGLRLADVVINALATRWGRHQQKEVCAKLYEGLAYMILSDEICARIGAWRPMTDRPTARVLMAFGGSDTHNMSERALAALSAAPRPIEVRLNLGPAAQPSSRLENAIQGSPHEVTVLRETPDLVDEFLAADLVVCGGGLMIYELAALGVPAAAVATEPHEVTNVEHMAAAGSAVALGTADSFDPPRAAKTIAELLADEEARRSMSSKGPAVIDGRGLERCVEIIEDLMG